MHRFVRFGLLLSLVAANASARTGYYLQPDIHSDRIVFVSEGDLWWVGVDGGTARRLTGHEGSESVPKYFPDGSRIAFSGTYDGNTDVYVIDADGGEPRRLTWHPGADECLDVSPDGRFVFFRSRRHHPNRNHEVFRVPVDGGDVERVPLGRAALIDVNSDGTIAFNRTSREYRTWKRYRGGTAQDIWSGPENGPFQRLTTFPGTDAFPMWVDDRLVFLSDEGGTANLWTMAADGTDRRRLTDEREWDLRWPSRGPGTVVVAMRAGDIVRVDVSSPRVETVPIDLPSDSVERRTFAPKPADAITWFDMSPDGERLLVVTRGELVTVPVDDDAGATLPLTRTSGVRERRASFGPKGKRIVYVTDRDGEDALAIRTIDGDEEVLRRGRDTGWLFPPRWSPNGSHVAIADETFRLYLVDVTRGREREIARSNAWEISEYVWSPDGRWLAYAMFEANTYRSIFLYDVENDATHRVTGLETDDFSPSFAPDGSALYFLSNRNVSPTIVWETRDFAHATLLQSRPYAVLLRDDVPHPFAPAWTTEDDGDESDEKKTKGDDLPPVRIDLDGLADRLVEVPTPPGIYQGLAAGAGGHLYFFAGDIAGTTESEAPGGTVVVFSPEDRETKPFLTGVAGYSLQPKADKVAAKLGDGRIVVVSGGAPTEDLSDAAVNLDNIVLEIDPHAEWAQKYHETWRNLRDFFWDEDMGGIDWPAAREQYAALLPRVGSHREFRDVVGELIGELATSHTYVWGGERGRRGTSRSVGLLGIDVSRDGDAARIDRIYRGSDADRAPSPLLAPGVRVKEGEYIVAVNGRPLRADRPFLAHFQDLAGKTVRLTVNDRPRTKGARHVVVTPLESERRLRYVDWTRRNREAVLEATDGKIGYVHLPDMDSAGIREFETWFYPQLNLEGMIVDVRYNGGGWVSQLVLERLRRKPLHWDGMRHAAPTPYPARVLNGPFVVLLNEEAGSDGDIFPSMVKKEGLAPVIGMRSWGGVIGIRSDKRLVDGMMVTHPEFSTWEPERGWIIENYGVDPDIEVNNLPHDEAAGVDAQLDAGVAEVLRLHRLRPPIEPVDTPKPRKSRGAFSDE